MGPFGARHGRILMPVFAIVNAAMFVAWILVMISAAMTARFSAGRCRRSGRFGLAAHPGPRSTSADGAAACRPSPPARTCVGPYYGPWAALSGLFWPASPCCSLLAYQHIPQCTAVLDQLPALWQKRQISLSSEVFVHRSLSLMSPGGFFRTNRAPLRNPNEAPCDDEFQSDHTSVTAQTSPSTKPSGSAKSRSRFLGDVVVP